MFQNFLAPPKSGEGLTLRILPRPGKFYAQSRIHGIDQKKFHCHREYNSTTNKWVGNCVACDYYQQGWQVYEKNPTQAPTHFRNIKPVERFYMNVISRQDEERGPLIWSCGKTLMQIILEGILGNPNSVMVPALGDVTDPKTGHDFFTTCNMRGAGGAMYPEYKGQFLHKSLLTEDEKLKKKWLKGIHDLDAIRVLKPESELLDALKRDLGISPSSLPTLSKRPKTYRNISEPFEPGW